MRYNAIQHITSQHDTTLNDTKRHNTTNYINTMQHHTLQYGKTLRCVNGVCINTTQRNTTQHFAIRTQHCAERRNAIQRITTQQNKIQNKSFILTLLSCIDATQYGRNTTQQPTTQLDATRYGGIQPGTTQYHTTRHNAMQHDMAHFIRIQRGANSNCNKLKSPRRTHNANRHKIIQRNALQHTTTQHRKTPYKTKTQNNTTQYGTIQHTTKIQGNTSRYNTMKTVDISTAVMYQYEPTRHDKSYRNTIQCRTIQRDTQQR